MRALPFAVLALLVGCATPVAPTGGPSDTTPPTLVEAAPADGTTGVTDRTITLTFSERLATGAASAVTVTPPSETPPEIALGARQLRITLPELRDSTTYVVTVGTSLADQRNVALRAPITLAFATGDAIDRGRIAGVVRQTETGASVASVPVWAYALTDTLTLPDLAAVAPDYQTETSTEGAFVLEYLRPGPYLVAAVDDRNRNARLDPGERFAAPPAPALLAREDSTAPAPTDFWVTTLDTIPPVAQRIRALSDRRFAVRFDEAVQLRDADALADAVAVSDSVSGTPVDVRWYQPPASAFEIYGVADRALPSSPLLVTASGTDALTDSVGLGLVPFRLSVTPPARPDTVTARFDAFLPGAPDSVIVGPSVRPAIRFTSPPGPLLDAVEVRANGERLDVPFVTSDGVTFSPDTSATLPVRFALAAPVGDSSVVQRYVRPGPRDRGGLLGRVDAPGPVLVELRRDSRPPIVVAADSDGAFVADGLLPGEYTLRIWADLDGNGRWSGGRLSPYQPPEPLRLLPEPVQVRARWETEIDPVVL